MTKTIMSQTPVSTHRQFDETFKREAVQNWLASRVTSSLAASLRCPSKPVEQERQHNADASIEGDNMQDANQVVGACPNPNCMVGLTE